MSIYARNVVRPQNTRRTPTGCAGCRDRAAVSRGCCGRRRCRVHAAWCAAARHGYRDRILSAFVRDGTKTKTDAGPPATDIQATLTVIGRRTAIGTGLPDLGNAHIPKAILYGANLSRAYLSDADLRGANLRDAFLRGAFLRGADLSRADLRRAHLSDAYLSGAILSGA